MSLHLVQYKQPLTHEELSFLRQKEERERGLLLRVIRALMVLCFICPFVVAWLRAMLGAEQPFSFLYYFVSVLFLLFLCALGVYWSYYNNLRTIQQDIRFGTKTIEKAYITRKQFMPSAGSFHLYLSSAIRISIEVSEEEYRRLASGDEVHIEYTSYSKQYLGYIL